MKQFIYADNAATTKLDNDAFEAMKPFLLDDYGNASQLYSFARKPKQALKEARASMQSRKKYFSLPVVRKVITGQLKA